MDKSFAHDNGCFVIAVTGGRIDVVRCWPSAIGVDDGIEVCVRPNGIVSVAVVVDLILSGSIVAILEPIAFVVLWPSFVCRVVVVGGKCVPALY